MRYRIALAIVLFAAFVAGAWVALRPPEFDDASSSAAAPPAPMAEVQAARAPAASKLGAASVLSIDPRANPLKAGGTAPHPKLFFEFQTAKAYKPIFDRLKNSPEGQTAEGWYVMYEMLRRCANVTERTARQPLLRTTEQKRDEFLASIPANDPQRDRRIAAFDEVSTNRCAGLENVTITQADLNKMLSNAAAAGDAKAQALSIEQELWAERRASGPAGRWGRDNVTLSDAQVAQLQQIAASRDPEAMVIAGRVLANSWHDFSMRIGPDNQLVEQRAFMQAWQLLACDYGAACGDNSPRVVAACAYQGHCNATTLPDYVYYYGSSPYDSQLLTQYREILRNAVETGNWSQLNVVRGPAPPGTGRMIFRQGPPGG